MLKTASLLLLGTLIMNAEVRIEKPPTTAGRTATGVSNGEIELIVTADIGRASCGWAFREDRISLGRAGGRGQVGEPAWMKRGGHRVWVGPEDLKYTYPPDNSPIGREGARAHVLIATEPAKKDWHRETDRDPNGRHGHGRDGDSPVEERPALCRWEYAPWALTMMAQGGTAITGFSRRRHA